MGYVFMGETAGVLFAIHGRPFVEPIWEEPGCRCGYWRSIFPGIRRLMLHEEQPPAAARAQGFAAKNAPAGRRQIRTISAKTVLARHWADTLPAPASASGSGQNGFGRFTVSAACCADLFWTDRGSLLLWTP